MKALLIVVAVLLLGGCILSGGDVTQIAHAVAALLGYRP